MRALGLSSALLLLSTMTGCVGGTLPRPAIEHNAAGAELLAAGDLDDAEARFRLALEYHPRFSEAHANLGLVALHRGDLEEAEACFRHAIGLNEDFALAYGNLGVTLEREGRRDAAEAAYLDALAIDPGLFEVRMNLAQLLVKEARFEHARAHLMRLVQVDGDSAAAQGLLAYAELRLGRLEAAERRADALLAAQPEAAVGHLVRGILAGAQGELEVAIDEVSRAVDDPILGAAARLRLSAFRVAQGRLVEAGRLLDPLLAAHEDDPAVRLVAAHLELARGRPREALRHARAVLAVRPGLAAAEAVLERACVGDESTRCRAR